MLDGVETRDRRARVERVAKKPRRCAHHMYSTGRCSSRPINSAIRFSIPFAAVVGERKVVGIGADFQGDGRRATRGGRDEGRRARDDDDR
jgi:hypothetical protein